MSAERAVCGGEGWVRNPDTDTFDKQQDSELYANKETGKKGVSQGTRT